MTSSKEDKILEDDPQPTGHRVFDAWGIQSSATDSGGAGRAYCDGCGHLVSEIDLTITEHPFRGVEFYCPDCAERLCVADIENVYNQSRMRAQKKLKGNFETYSMALQRKLWRHQLAQAEARLALAKHALIVKAMQNSGIGL